MNSHFIMESAKAVFAAFGIRGLLRRLAYVVRLRIGWFRRRMPLRDSYDQIDPQPFSHELAIPDLESYESDVIERAAALMNGKMRYYGWADQDVGWPPRWHRNPIAGHVYPKLHWTAISDDDPSAGDIKDVWEPSRFTWVFLLARAYARTGDDRWPEAFWNGVESWMEDNPPNTGVNWRCAQESSLRGIAVQFGLGVFGTHPSTTPARRRSAGQLLEATRRRVRPTVGYALSQRNNHAVSELCFLLTLNPVNRRLNRLLRECLFDQFYADGSYSQQSPNYQRLAVHTLLWLDQTTDLQPRTKAAVDDALDRSGLFLKRILDPVSCHAPNYGPNDGALLLDLDTAAHADFGPTLDLLGMGDGSSESAAWFGQRPTPHPGSVSEDSTYVTLTVGRTHVLMRCGTGRHRLGHDDQLSVDIWMHGENLVPDPGTYRYTAPAPWGNPLTVAAVHSRPRVDAETPVQIGRFLTAPVVAATVQAREEQDEVSGITAVLSTSRGSLRRTVCVDQAGVSVLDETFGGLARGRLNTDGKTSTLLQIDSPSKEARTPVEADPSSGWLSPHYGERLAGGAVDYSFAPGYPAAITVGAPSAQRKRLIERLLGASVQAT